MVTNRETDCFSFARSFTLSNLYLVSDFILKRELTDLDEEFTSLRYLSDELRIRAAGLRVHQKAA